jgi:hypothetical protein
LSYLVCHVQKFKASDVKGMQIHNQRESKNNKNKDIDPRKTELNHDLHNQQHINYNHKVKDIIKEGYIGEKAIRKDAVVMTSTLITSDGEFFKKISPLEQKNFFESAYDKLKDLYGEKNIVSAVVHMDETTPHMHFCSVPLTEQGKLSAKIIFNRQNLLSLQKELPTYLQSKGFEIQKGEGSEKKHIEINEFKERTLKNKSKEIDIKLSELNQNEKILDKNKMELDKTADKIQSELSILRSDLKHLVVSDDVILEKVSLPFMKGKIVVSKSQYDDNIALGKVGMVTIRENQVLKIENQQLKQANEEEIRIEVLKVKDSYKDIDSLKAENQRLKSDNIYYHSENIKSSRTIRNLTKENRSLSNELKINEKAIGKTISKLSDNDQDIFKQTLEKEVKVIKRSLTQDKDIER